MKLLSKEKSLHFVNHVHHHVHSLMRYNFVIQNNKTY